MPAPLIGILVFAVLAVFTAAQPNQGSPSPGTPGSRLIEAVNSGDVALARQLLDDRKRKGQPLPLASDDRPLLFVAIEGREVGHPAIIELLLGHGADIKQRGPWGMSALHWAASRSYVERVDQMLKHRAPLDAKDDFGRTPLLIANSDAAAKLLAAKADLLATDRNGNTAFHYAAENGPAHLRLLFDAGFKVVDARNNSRMSPLHFAAVAGNPDSCRWLLDHGANVNAVTSAAYDYLSLQNAPGYGNEIRVPAGSTAMQIATMRHGSNKWVSQRFKRVLEVLASRGPATQWSPPPALQAIFALVSPIGLIALVAGLFVVDARMIGWRAMAQRFAASSTHRGSQ